MHFPPLAYLGKSALIALALGLLGYLALPATLTGSAALDAALLLGIGALLGALLSAVRLQSEAVAEEGAEDPTPQTLFVGNLAFKASEEDLRGLFSPHGQVTDVRIMRDRKTRRPRGYGFVEMPRSQARRAIRALDGKDFLGRNLRVKEGNRRDANGDQE